MAASRHLTAAPQPNLDISWPPSSAMAGPPRQGNGSLTASDRSAATGSRHLLAALSRATARNISYSRILHRDAARHKKLDMALGSPSVPSGPQAAVQDRLRAEGAQAKAQRLFCCAKAVALPVCSARVSGRHFPSTPECTRRNELGQMP
eukprot:gene12395-biopygen6863